MDRAHHWICGFVHCGAGSGGVVHELGTPPRLYSICDLPDHRGNRRAGVGDERARVVIARTGKIAKNRRNLKPTTVEKQRRRNPNTLLLITPLFDFPDLLISRSSSLRASVSPW